MRARAPDMLAAKEGGDPTGLAPELQALARVSPPEGLTDAVMGRLSRERRFLGHGPREWALVCASFSVWTLAVLGLVHWATSQLVGF